MNKGMKIFGTVGIASVLALAGNALGQSSREIEGSLDQPLMQNGGGGSSVTHIIENDGKTSYDVEVRDGKVTAKVDGKVIPAKRVRQSRGKIEILDSDGDVMKTFEVGADLFAAPRVPRRARAFSGQVAPAPQPPTLAPSVEMTRPKTMLGIRMDPSAEEVVLTEVIEGLPADKAGLKAGDVLVSVAGKKIGEVGDIREAIKDKDPGDKVKVVVRRDGDEKKFDLTLEAWNDQTLYGEEMTPGSSWPQAWQQLGQAGQDTSRLVDEARKALAKALREIDQSDAKAQFKDSWSDAMKQAMKALDQSRDAAGNWFNGLALPSEGSGQSRVFTFSPGSQGGQVYVAPRMHGQAWTPAQGDDRLDEMSQRLDELSERLDKLTRALEKNNP